MEFYSMRLYKVLKSSLVLIFTLAFYVECHAEFKASPLAKAAPEGVSASIREVLATEGWQILGDDGKTVLNVWLRKEIPGSSKPEGPKGNILFPFLAEGELMAAVEVVSQVGDYRDQPIAPGLYTFRYGVQPINGDHLGASPNRDFGCLIPANKDQKSDRLTRKNLEHDSAEAAGTSHPAIMMFLAPETDVKAGQILRDDANDRTSVVLPIVIKSSDNKASVMLQWIVSGRAPV
jgi:hypothetical protein